MSTPTVLPLCSLFPGRLFRVPDYQRGYAWTRQQLDDFWLDLEVLRPDGEHFMGMLVVKLRAAGAGQEQECELIDGQQRLTTTVLLMDALVDALRSLGGPEGERAADDLASRYIRSGGLDRLRLNADSRSFFQEILAQELPSADPENRSQQNLLAAALFFRDAVRALATEDPVETCSHLLSLVERAEAGLRFLLYPVSRDAEAGLIFEVMNNRGRALSQADLVKNYLLYTGSKQGMHQELLDDVAQAWGGVFKQVMRSVPDGTVSTDAEDRLLRNHWVLYTEANPSRETRSLSISQRIRATFPLVPPDPQVGTKIRSYTDSLRALAPLFALVLNPSDSRALAWTVDQPQQRALTHTLASFTRMGHTATALPLLLSGLATLRAEPALGLELADALSVFSFRVYAVCNHRGHTGQSEFRRKAHWLYNASAEDRPHVARQIIKSVQSWTRHYAPDDKFRTFLLSDDFYRSHRAQELRYFFYEWERELCGAKELSYEWSAFANPRTTQVEHIWPQNPQEESFLGRSQEKHDSHVHRLGNLTVTRFNQTLSNKPFRQKKPIYRSSNLVIENVLAEERGWSMKRVNERGLKLAEFALRRWSLPRQSEG